jgi:hypothetical protein
MKDNKLYICNSANTEHCLSISSCEHKIPHKLLCANCDGDKGITCDCNEVELCTHEDRCYNGMDDIKVKCILYEPEFFLTEKDMEI